MLMYVFSKVTLKAHDRNAVIDYANRDNMNGNLIVKVSRYIKVLFRRT